jgi:hypothetical protein
VRDDLEEDFLGRVLGILGMAEHPHTDVVDPCLVPTDQRFEGRPMSSSRPCHKGLIVPIVRIIAGERGLNVHHLLSL